MIQNQALLVRDVVKTFRGHAVVSGVVVVTEDQLIQHLDAVYGEVVICNLNIKPGDALLQLAPLRFRALMNDYKEELQSSLQSQLANGNDVDVEYHS